MSGMVAISMNRALQPTAASHSLDTVHDENHTWSLGAHLLYRQIPLVRAGCLTDIWRGPQSPPAWRSSPYAQGRQPITPSLPPPQRLAL